MATRTEHIAVIYEELAALLRTRTTAAWLDLLDRADVPAMPLHSLESLLQDEHLAASHFFSWVDHPSEGRLRQMAYPSSWSRSQPACSRPVPRLGEHSAEVLREIGYDEVRIAGMLAAGTTALPNNP